MSDDDPVLECARQMASITAAMMEEGLLVGGPVSGNVIDIIHGYRDVKTILAKARDQLQAETIRREELERMNRQLQRRIDDADRVIVAQAHRMLEHGAL